MLLPTYPTPGIRSQTQTAARVRYGNEDDITLKIRQLPDTMYIRVMWTFNSAVRG